MFRFMLIVVIFFASSVHAEQNVNDKIIIAKHISAINLYDSMYKAVDKACETSFSLSDTQVMEIDKLTKEKSGIGYVEFNETMGDPDFIQSIVDTNLVNMLIELGGCDIEALNEWHRTVKVDFDQNLVALRSTNSTVTQ
ncbi:hypothetical protein EYS14_00805 [Alteromonadaceae bacterium M269]|nr:hypothetical protein EYS14_00805 [Alteromonadaceae bacterium M269]